MFVWIETENIMAAIVTDLQQFQNQVFHTFLSCLKEPNSTNTKQIFKTKTMDSLIPNVNIVCELRNEFLINGSVSLINCEKIATRYFFRDDKDIKDETEKKKSDTVYMCLLHQIEDEARFLQCCQSDYLWVRVVEYPTLTTTKTSFVLFELKWKGKCKPSNLIPNLKISD